VRFSKALSQECFTRKWWLIQSRNLELYKKQTFKTCQFNEERLAFASLNLNIIAQKKAHFIDDALKTRALNIHMLRLGGCLRPQTKYLTTRLCRSNCIKPKTIKPGKALREMLNGSTNHRQQQVTAQSFKADLTRTFQGNWNQWGDFLILSCCRRTWSRHRRIARNV